MKWKAIILAVLAVAIAAGYVCTDYYTTLPSGAVAQYVGRKTCVECHQTQGDLFHGSHHDLAMDVASDSTVLGDFSDRTIRAHNVESRFFRDGSRFMVHTEGPDGKMADFEVKYVFGVEPLQQYMVEFDRTDDMSPDEIARLQVLSLCWDTERKKWFQLQPPDVKEKVEPGDPLHWTGRTQCWNTSCADCHSTNLKKNFDLEKLQYRTTFSEIDVSCEACHGPGSQHVEMARSWSLFWDRKIGYGLADLKSESSKTQIETCAKCHSRRGSIAEGFCAGQNYYDYYTSELLTEQTYHDDGQIKDEVYVYGSFLQSKMYHEGIRCTDCHDPHTTRVRFDTNELCTSCHAHPAGKYDTPNHHRHQPGSTGARCVECHMPATTYMAVDPRRDHSLRIPRPDLSVKFKTPNACTQCHIDAGKLPQAQQEKLTGKQYLDWLLLARDDPAVAGELERLDRWSMEAVRQWHGTEKWTPHYAEAFHRIRANGDDSDAHRMLRQLVTDRKTPEIVRGTAAMELGRNSGSLQRTVNRAFLGPDKDLISPALKQLQVEEAPLVIQGLLQTVELEITSIVRATWKYNGFDRRGMPVYEELVLPLTNYTAALARLMDHSLRMVRIEAVRVMLRVPSDVRARLLDSRQLARFEVVFDELIDSVRSNQERGTALLALGSIYQLRVDVPMAFRAEFDAKRLKKSDEYFELARQAYRDAIRVAPGESGARGNLAAMNDQLVEQIDLELQALAGDNQSERARALAARKQELLEESRKLRKDELAVLGDEARRAYASRVGAGVIDRYAMALYVDGQVDACEQQLKRALELEPEDPMIVLHYALVLEKQEKFAQALEYANKLLKLVPNDPSYRQLRDNLRNRLGN